MKLFVCLHSLKFISGFTVVINDSYFIIAITLLDLQVHVKLKKTLIFSIRRSRNKFAACLMKKSRILEVYSKPCKTSKMELFDIIVNR